MHSKKSKNAEIMITHYAAATADGNIHNDEKNDEKWRDETHLLEMMWSLTRREKHAIQQGLQKSSSGDEDANEPGQDLQVLTKWQWMYLFSCMSSSANWDGLHFVICNWWTAEVSS